MKTTSRTRLQPISSVGRAPTDKPCKSTIIKHKVFRDPLFVYAHRFHRIVRWNEKALLSRSKPRHAPRRRSSVVGLPRFVRRRNLIDPIFRVADPRILVNKLSHKMPYGFYVVTLHLLGQRKGILISACMNPVMWLEIAPRELDRLVRERLRSRTTKYHPGIGSTRLEVRFRETGELVFSYRYA